MVHTNIGTFLLRLKRYEKKEEKGDVVTGEVTSQVKAHFIFVLSITQQ